VALKASLNIILESLSKPDSETNASAEKTTADSVFSSVVVLSVFVLLFSFITITGFLQKSPTVDEPTHLFAGYSYLKWGDFRANPEHPPLAKLWAALPLLAFDLKDPRQSSAYWNLIPQYSPDAMYTVAVAAETLFMGNNAETVFFYAKLQMVVLGVLLGLFVYRWSKELFGFQAAVASLCIYCFDPNVLAHSQFVHTDIAFTAMFFIGSYFFWRASDKLTWPNLVLTSLFFGLAAITKYAYLAMIVVWSVLGLARVFSPQPQRCTLGAQREVSSRWGKAALLSGVLLCSLVTAYFFIWLAYGFRFDAIATEGQHLPMAQQLPENPYLQELINFITQYHLFPEAWIYGQLYVFNNLQRDAYLMGSYSDHGFWLYYPVAFAVKTPVPTLLLLIGSIWLWISKDKSRRSGLFLLIPIMVYFSLGVWSRINIGLRHILPIYPFLFVLLGGTAAKLWSSGSRVKRGALAVLASWYLWSAISIYPHYLAFFNEIAGGPENGHRVLLDSNLDWGQDLKGLKRWMDDNRVKKIQFLYFGFFSAAEPRYYGIDADYLPGSWVAHDSMNNSSEVPNILAISANHLYGHFLRGERREDFVKPFRSLKPAGIIGHSIYVYRMDDAIKELRKAVEMHPTSGQAHADLASLLENQKNLAEAVEHYRQAIQFNPPPTKALYNLGIILAKQGALEEASELLRRATASRPLDSDIHYDLALVLAMRGNLDEGMEQLRATLRIDPTYTGAHYNLGILLARKGRIEEAIASLRKTLSIDPTHSRAHYHLGVMLANRGNTEEAISEFRQALRTEPEFADAHESLGRALALQGNRNEALAHYEEAMRIVKSRAATQTLPR
jgi:Flp pilus assembly protein TadD